MFFVFIYKFTSHITSVIFRAWIVIINKATIDEKINKSRLQWVKVDINKELKTKKVTRVINYIFVEME